MRKILLLLVISFPGAAGMAVFGYLVQRQRGPDDAADKFQTALGFCSAAFSPPSGCMGF